MIRIFAKITALHLLLACGCDKADPTTPMAGNTDEDIFAEVLAKQDKLFADFKQCDTTIIEGVVAPSGLGAATGSEICHLTFATLPWRRQGGELIHEKAIVHKRCSKEEVDAIFQALSAYSLFRIEGRLLESLHGWEGAQIELLRIIEVDQSDSELRHAVEKVKKPVTYEDAQFGVFILDRSIGCYETQTTWRGSATRLSFESEEGSGAFPRDCLEHARLLWESAERWDYESRSFVLKELLDLKNNGWLEEDEKKLSADDFLRRISLSTIAVYSDGSFEFWYDDGDLFGGHSIMVSGSIESGVTDAGIHG